MSTLQTVCRPTTSGNRDSHGDSHGDYARWLWFGLLWMVGLVATQACQPLLVGYYMRLTLASFLLLCAWIDARTKRIPNRLTYPLIVLGLSGHSVVAFMLATPSSAVFLRALRGWEPVSVFP